MMMELDAVSIQIAPMARNVREIHASKEHLKFRVAAPTTLEPSAATTMTVLQQNTLVS
jgi:hypothetical protein